MVGRILAAWFALTTLIVVPSALAVESELWAERDRIDSAFGKNLAELASRCDELQLAPQAQVTRDWLIPRDPQRQYIFLPAEADQTAPPPDAPQVVQFWHQKFSEHRRRQAADLYALAEKALAVPQPAWVYQLLNEVLHEDPDHEAARRALGYRRVNGVWRQPTATNRARPMRLAHPEFGWPAGQYWRIDTAHFKITTSHSAEEGLRLGRSLEDLYDVWQQVFFTHWSNETALVRRLSAAVGASRSSKQHDVILFRDRDEYVAKLSPMFEGIAVSEGFYADRTETAYFYASDAGSQANWFHEVTHQLFQESGHSAARVGLRGNAWVIEGIALYMESLAPHDGYYTVGGFDAPRLQFARYRALNDGFYVPLAELAALGRDDLQRDERIRMLYTQSDGLAHFLMDYQRGRYRQAMVDFVGLVYDARDARGSLADLTGVSLTDLDAQYRKFLNVTDDEVTHFVGSPDRLENLALGHTDVTDVALRRLVGYDKIQWLDLTATRATDAGVAFLEGAVRLHRLNLEGTSVTDAALETIARLPQLEELDLSQTRITNDGLARLATMTRLKSLWLTGTSVSDEGISPLQNCTQLQWLDVNKTAVTAEGLKALERKLPNLNRNADE